MSNLRRGLLTLALSLAVFPTLLPTSQGEDRAEGLSSSFRKAVDRVLPAVVVVKRLDLVGSPERGFDPLGRLIPETLSQNPIERAVSVDRDPPGSGLVVDAAAGLILTADRIVVSASRIAVILADGQERVAERVLRDPRSGLALIQISLQGLKLSQAEWGDPSRLQVGDWVLAIGRYSSRTRFMSAGIFSGPITTAEGQTQEGLLLSDTVINALNTGGPLVDLEGKVVGINLPAQTGRLQGIGHAMSADVARRVASELAGFGRVRRAYLGITIAPAARGLAEAGGQPSGVMVSGVAPGSPAAEAGMQTGDRILAVDRRPVSDVPTLMGLIDRAAVGQEVVLDVDRGGQKREMKIRTSARAESTGGTGIDGGSPQTGWRMRQRERPVIVRPNGPRPAPVPVPGRAQPSKPAPVRPRPPVTSEPSEDLPPALVPGDEPPATKPEASTNIRDGKDPQDASRSQAHRL